jgi:hypothetical protein
MAGSTFTFVVRLIRSELGNVTGVVEQVKTGLKVRVNGLEAVAQVIGQMIERPGRSDVQIPEE